MRTSEQRLPLRRTEAEQRAGQINVGSVSIEIDVTDPAADTFYSRSTINFTSTGPESFVEFRGCELITASLNGEHVDPRAWRGGRIALRDLQPQNALTVEGRMAYAHDGEGLSRTVDREDGRTYLYAMSFLDAAPRWFACFDQPDLKAQVRLRVRAPAGWTVLGNGPAQRIAESTWSIESKGPLPSYLVTLVAGPYASVLDEHDGIPLGLHARASLAEPLRAEAVDLLQVTKESFDYYHSRFARRYPFGEYHQAFVPDFNGGAMENPGCVTLRDTFVFRSRATRSERARRAGVVAHEMAHMWFGDLVTMRWWNDLWLNESFAEYLAQRCCSEATGYALWTEFGIVRKDWGSVVEQSPSTHPVAGNEAADSLVALQQFDGISYAKGAAVLKQLALRIGDEPFFAGLQSYFDRFAWGNATFADLIEAWVAVGADDLPRWAEAWLRTAGMDTIDLQGSSGETLLVRRAGPGGHARSHALVVGAVDERGVVTEVTRPVLGAEPVQVDLPARTMLVVPDGTDATWAKIRFGPDGWSRVADALPMITDEPVLVVIGNALRDAVRDAELDPALALDLVLAGVSTAPADLMVSVMLGFAADQLAGAYCPPAIRAVRLARVAQAARELVDDSRPGSDRQLAGFRILVRAGGEVDTLHRWYRNEGVPPGLEVDDELRWTIVRRLAVLDPDPGLVEDALTRDPSTSAVLHAARASAALGLESAKERAWDRLMHDPELGAYELYGLAEGFFDPEQDDLTAAYVPRYFAEIAGTVALRSGWVLGEVAVRAYPWCATANGTLELAEQALAGELPAGVRRALVDGTDKLRRAIRSLSRFG